ncbi:MAG TPA: imidazoleglycerol-phosphate dehydratase HisB [Methanoregulaceae archaeon]|nr:imidazoleglycerol-phosphate dehydratase HisB [Methanoregulaceae archaeon]
MRRAELRRATNETEIALVLDLDGTGKADVRTGLAFFDHMLNAFARHGRFDLTVEAAGDLAVDAHHTVEDVGIVLGTALKQALGEGRGIRRFGFAAVPMDEALARCAVDCGGRAYLVYDAQFSGHTVGGMDVSLVRHFLESVCQHAGCTLHLQAYGRNNHHVVEAVFKAVGVALRSAVALEPGNESVPSTKGVL